MSGEAVLELDGVTKVYGEQPPVPALRGVSFSVRRGELVAIVGPSGSGKSTLLHVIGTLERPSSGVVRIGGVDAARLSDRELSRLRAREIGFVFQQFFLAEHATVRENVADGLLYAGVAAAERYARADEALERVGLSDARDVQAHQALRRGAAAGCDRPGPRRASGDRARRRTDREPRQHHRRIDHGAHPRAQRRRRHHPHDHARRGPRRSAAAPDPDAGRPGGLRLHECRRRAIAAEGRAAGGERRAARPAAARRAVRARDRDRNGGDRGGPRVVLLLAGRAARGDRPARHEPADRRGRTEPHRGGGEAAARGAGADHAPGRRRAGGAHRPDGGREGLPELDDPGGQQRWPPGAGHQPEPAVRAQHRHRTRRLAQRGHRPRAGRGARLGRRRSGWASTGSTPISGSGWEASGSTSRAS